MEVLSRTCQVPRVDLDGVELRLSDSQFADHLGDDPGRALAQVGAGLHDLGWAMLGENPSDCGGELGLTVDLGEVQLVGIVGRDLHPAGGQGVECWLRFRSPD